MEIQEFASYASVSCGSIMVITSLFFLHKGIISLNKSSREKAISIDFKKQIRISSHYPALALFILGWTFIMVPMFIAAPSKIAVEGVLRVNPPHDLNRLTVRIIGGPWDIEPDSDGSLGTVFYPNLDKMKIEITGPGRHPYIKTFSPSIFGGIDLGNIKIPDAKVNIITLKPVGSK